MRKFIVDFEGEEEHEPEVVTRLAPTHGIPAILYMITFSNTVFVERALTTIIDMCGEDIPYVGVKYQRKNGPPRFGIGFTPEAIRQPGVIDCLNEAGRAHLGNPYHFVIYYDDTRYFIPSTSGQFLQNNEEILGLPGLGRSKSTAAKSELAFIDIVEI